MNTNTPDQVPFDDTTRPDEKVVELAKAAIARHKLREDARDAERKKSEAKRLAVLRARHTDPEDAA